MNDEVKALITKAVKAANASEALHYSQAALNAAQTLATMIATMKHANHE